ncbi:MAG: hypothetical protein ACRDTM_01295, partial [Micromonosporaceae bacterium]
PPARSHTPGPDRTPSPSGSAVESPSPSAGPSRDSVEPTEPVPDSAMLQPQDVGPGYRVGSPQGYEDGDLTWLFGAVCGQGTWTRAKTVAGNVRALERTGQPTVFEVVNRYAPGHARQYLTDLIATTDRCRTMKSDDRTITLTIVDHDIAGDAGILIRIDDSAAPSDTRYEVFVRQGELVASIWARSEEQGRALAGKAAARLCVATPTC